MTQPTLRRGERWLLRQRDFDALVNVAHVIGEECFARLDNLAGFVGIVNRKDRRAFPGF